MHRVVLFAAGLLVLFLAVQLRPSPEPREAPAREESTSVRPTASQAASNEPRLFTTGNLFALLLLTGGGLFALHLRKQSTVNRQSAALESIGELQLAPGQAVRLVRCGDDTLLLGVTASQVTLLQRYDSERAAAFFPAPAGDELQESTAAQPTPDFSSLFRQALGRTTHA